jgi:hypothetical protein
MKWVSFRAWDRQIVSFFAYDWRPAGIERWIRSLRSHVPITYITDSGRG